MGSNGGNMNPSVIRSPARRQQLQRGLAALLAPALSACTAPLPAMRVGCIVFPGYEDLVLARELGLLDERRVRLVELLDNTDSLRALAAGQIEAATMTLDELMTARADGVDLCAVLVFDVSDGADVVLAKPGVTLQRLAGRRVAVEDGAVGALMLSALLQAAGLTPRQIDKFAMTLDRSEEVFANGGVDVVVTAEPWAARLEKKGAQRIFDSRAIPGRIVDVLAVRRAELERHGAALRHLLDCHFQAQRLLRDSPERAAALLAPRLQTPPAEVMALFRGLRLPDLAENRRMLVAGGPIDQSAEALHGIMHSAGLLGPNNPLTPLADARFLPL